jgi:hypothetical protein
MQKTLIFCLLVFDVSCSAQELGLRYGNAWADNKALTSPLGVGAFLISTDSAKKICVLLSFDFYLKNRELEKTNLHSNSLRFKYSVGILRVLPLSKNIKFKIGPAVSYQRALGDVDYDTMYPPPGDSNYIGAGIILNLKIERLFHSNINFDTFLSPEYLFYIDRYHKPDVRIAGFNMGISF